MKDNSRNTALVRQRVVSVILGVIAIVAVVIAVSEHRSSSATPQTITGKFMGFDTTGTAMAFQPTGSANGTSYAWAPDTQWQSANGTDGSRILSPTVGPWSHNSDHWCCHCQARRDSRRGRPHRLGEVLTIC